MISSQFRFICQPHYDIGRRLYTPIKPYRYFIETFLKSSELASGLAQVLAIKKVTYSHIVSYSEIAAVFPSAPFNPFLIRFYRPSETAATWG
jgi:hypothetical protein